MILILQKAEKGFMLDGGQEVCANMLITNAYEQLFPGMEGFIFS